MPKAWGLGVSDSHCTWLLEEGKLMVTMVVFCFPNGPMYYVPIWVWWSGSSFAWSRGETGLNEQATGKRQKTSAVASFSFWWWFTWNCVYLEDIRHLGDLLRKIHPLKLADLNSGWHAWSLSAYVYFVNSVLRIHVKGLQSLVCTITVRKTNVPKTQNKIHLLGKHISMNFTSSKENIYWSLAFIILEIFSLINSEMQLLKGVGT